MPVTKDHILQVSICWKCTGGQIKREYVDWRLIRAGAGVGLVESGKHDANQGEGSLFWSDRV